MGLDIFLVTFSSLVQQGGEVFATPTPTPPNTHLPPPPISSSHVLMQELAQAASSIMEPLVAAFLLGFVCFLKLKR